VSELLSELEQKKAANRIYNWLRGLSVVSVPWFVLLVFYLGVRPSTVERIWVAALPASPYLFYLSLTGGTSNHVFIKRHVRQGLAIVFLRFFTAFLATGFGGDAVSGLPFFLIANGLLWYFGSSTGKLQVNGGVGMFVRQSERLSRRSIIELEEGPKEIDGLRASPAAKNAAAVDHFVRGEELLRAGRNNEAGQSFAAAYQAGDSRIRELVTRQLEAMGREDLIREKPVHPESDSLSGLTATQAAALGEVRLGEGRNREAVQAFTAAFRKGDAQTRELATRQLDALDEVEEF
jgi:hypothetical protein